MLNSTLTDGLDYFYSLTLHAFGESLVFDTGLDKVMIHPGKDGQLVASLNSQLTIGPAGYGKLMIQHKNCRVSHFT